MIDLVQIDRDRFRFAGNERLRPLKAFTESTAKNLYRYRQLKTAHGKIALIECRINIDEFYDEVGIRTRCTGTEMGRHRAGGDKVLRKRIGERGGSIIEPASFYLVF